VCSSDLVLPFLLVVTLSIPFMKKDAVGGGYNLGLGGLSISRSGLWVLWNVGIKSCLGVFSAILLSSTTSFPQLVRGMEKLGLVFQSPEDQLFCPTVFDDVAFGPLNMGLDEEEVRQRVQKALEMMGLKGFEGRSAHHLSEGEKKRVALATVLSMDSEILALDEPTDNLDPAGSRMLIERIQSIPQTKIIVTHHLPVAFDLCERAVLLCEGRKIGDLSMGELLKDRALLERFGFDADYARWMYERDARFQSPRPE